jgi:hypothetical protein
MEWIGPAMAGSGSAWKGSEWIGAERTGLATSGAKALNDFPRQVLARTGLDGPGGARIGVERRGQDRRGQARRRGEGNGKLKSRWGSVINVADPFFYAHSVQDSPRRVLIARWYGFKG